MSGEHRKRRRLTSDSSSSSSNICDDGDSSSTSVSKDNDKAVAHPSTDDNKLALSRTPSKLVTQSTKADHGITGFAWPSFSKSGHTAKRPKMDHREVAFVDDALSDRMRIRRSPSSNKAFRLSSPPGSIDIDAVGARQHACKYAKAGCPFVGDINAVVVHEETYCSPLYTQLASYKMLSERLSRQIEASRQPIDRKKPSRASTYSFAEREQSRSPVKAAVTSTDPTSPLNADLQQQITRLQADLDRAQTELEREKSIRTERLRKAALRNMDMLSITTQDAIRVDHLRTQLRSEREYREQLEVELDILKAKYSLA